MYFWRIGRLKVDLASDRLPEPLALKYLLATLIFLALMTELSAWAPVERTAASMVAAAATFAVSMFGTYAAYVSNGGAQGSDFLARYFAISWVVSIRVCAAAVLVLLAFVLLSAATDAAWLADPEASIPGENAIVVLFVALIYWRVASHMSGVRAGPTAAAVLDAAG